MTTPPTTFQRRIVIGAVICVAAFALVGVRLVDVTLLKSAGVPAAHNAFANLIRADIVDRNGELLARDLPVKDLYARPQTSWDKRRAAHDLAAATGADEKRLRGYVRLGKHPYVLVARQLTPDVRDKVMHLGLPGLEFEAWRQALLSRRAHDGPGARRDRSRRQGYFGTGAGTRSESCAANSPAAKSPPRSTCASNTSWRMRPRRRAKEFKARAAGGIVMDVRTGEVLAMVSLPDFDPNARDFGAGDSTRNIMAQDVYELGSVFKIFAFALAMEDHTMRLDEIFRSAMASRSAATPSTKPSTCPPRLPRAISWRSPPISARRRSRCARALSASARFSTIWVCSRRSRTELAGIRPPALSFPLGRDRNGDHWLRPRHLG